MVGVKVLACLNVLQAELIAVLNRRSTSLSACLEESAERSDRLTLGELREYRGPP